MREDGHTSAHPWRRHDLLHVAPDAWVLVLARCPSLGDLPLVTDWADRRWPVVVRCPDVTDARHLVPVGVPLPPSAGKQRVALMIPPEGVLQRSPPPALQATAGVANPGWRWTIDALVAVGERTGVEPSAFGSLLWQHVTGLAYLSPHSDLDVLWSIPKECDVLSLISGIEAVQRTAPLRIDGEVIFPDGSAVNWRELWNAYGASDQSTVLAKTMDGVRLLDTRSMPGMAHQS